MYDLRQAAILAYNHLHKCLAPHGNSHVVSTAGVWKHKTHPTHFFVCVDDFDIKYFTKDDADHIINSIGQHYQYITDLKGINYCGLTLNWNYSDEYVDISMHGYIKKYIKRLQQVPATFPNIHLMNIYLYNMDKHSLTNIPHHLIIPLIFLKRTLHIFKASQAPFLLWSSS